MFIFNVPKELLVVKPKAYTPQSISISPYHHWRYELYDMEFYKLQRACRFQKESTGSSLSQLLWKSLGRTNGESVAATTSSSTTKKKPWHGSWFLMQSSF